MLKSISTVRSCFGKFNTLRIDLSFKSLYFMHRNIFNATNLLKNGKSLNRKSIIPETVSRCSPNVLNHQLKTSAVNMDPVVGSGHEQPSIEHACTGGSFQVSPLQNTNNFTNSSSESNVRRYCTRPTHIAATNRMWETLTNPFGPKRNNFKFKLLSYNVLAQYLLEGHRYLYQGCPLESLNWELRSIILLDEIYKLSPDILCLQEVECTHLSTFYKRLEDFGYVGVFKQKTGNRPDGCAIYYKSSVFKMKEHISVEFYQPGLPILNRDNIGIVLKLVPLSMPESSLVVGTTHLLFNPKRTDVRLAQMQLFLAEIDRFAYSTKKGKGHAPIILTGDLNSTPQSAVINLLSYGNVAAGAYQDNSDWRKIGVTDNCQHLAVHLSRLKGETDRISINNLNIYNSEHELTKAPGLYNAVDGNNELFNSGVLGHSLQLKSVYNQIKYNGQMEATTFQKEWVTVDYIYFSSQSGLNLLERLYLPTAKECGTFTPMPNFNYGSDHLSLGAVFELKR